MITVSKAAIVDKDESNQPVDPEVGDMVQITNATAKVVGIDGDNIQLAVQSVNGKPANDGEDAEDAADNVDDGAMEHEGADDPMTGAPINKMGAALLAKAAMADKRAGRV